MAVQPELPRPDIAEVLAELTDLNVEDVPSGHGWVRMRCPFPHATGTGQDRNASAAVNHDSGGFICQGCGVKGDGLALLQRQGRLSFREACDRARALGGDTAAGPPGKKPARRRRASDIFGS